MSVGGSWRRFLLCAGLVASAGRPARGAAPLGTEFQINTLTAEFQQAPDVAVAADGSFVVVWMSSNQDGANAGVFGQRYDATGARVGVEFQVNSATTSSEVYPKIAVEADGDFVVVWAGPSVGAYSQIDGQRFTSTGARSGSEFMINTYVTSRHQFPAVATDGDGDFIVAWASYEQEGVSNFGGIYAQRFDSSGTKVGGEFHVNSYIPKVQFRASVAAETNGDFLIVWDSRGDPDNTFGIRAKRYTSAGVAVGGEFAVNTYTPGTQYQSAVAMDSDGDFVVVWAGYKYGGNTEIFARRFNSNGSALASEFQVNTYTPGYQGTSFVTGAAARAVAMDSDGDFVVVWMSGGGRDGSSYGQFGQRFTSAGVAVGSEFQVNTFTTSDQVQGAAAMETDGDFVVAWQSKDQDGSSYGVFGRRFAFGGGGGATPTATPTRTPTVTPSPTGPTPTPTSTPTVTPTVTPGGKTLDIDGNGSVAPLTDGLLVLRRLFAFSGPALIGGAVGGGCTRCESVVIASYIDSILPMLDIDDNGGAPAPLSDGLLILRRTFGFSSTALVAGAVAGNCMRCDPTDIATYIDGLSM